MHKRTRILLFEEWFSYLLYLSKEDAEENKKRLLKMIGDYERLADHAVNFIQSSEELDQKGIVFSEQARKEMDLLTDAVKVILDLSYIAFKDNDLLAARKTEPLEQVIDELKEAIKTKHMLRLQKGECSVDAGFVWSDLLIKIMVR